MTQIKGLNKKIYITPYNRASESVTGLRNELGLSNILTIMKDKPKIFARKENLIILNWGRSDRYPLELKDKTEIIINQPNSVAKVSNKLSFFREFVRLPVKLNVFSPSVWFDSDDIPDDAFPVVCRTVLNGHSGEGIVIANNPDELVDAQLYTKYIKKTHEYRVHFFRGDCFIQQKKRRLDVTDEQVNWQVRNFDNGFTYANPTEAIPEEILALIEELMLAFKLDFGAVDVIYNKKNNQFFVLEINTAPGIQGSTLDFYVNSIKKVFNENS